MNVYRAKKVAGEYPVDFWYCREYRTWYISDPDCSGAASDFFSPGSLREASEDDFRSWLSAAAESFRETGTF
jgi:hypothetical protein